MASESDDKSEAPTPRRREQAREEGQVVSSPDLTTGILLLILALTCWFFGRYWFDSFGITIRERLEGVRRMDWGAADAAMSLRWLGVNILFFSSAVLGGAWLLSAGTVFLQVGPGIHMKPLLPDPERLSLSKGWSKLVSMDNLIRGVLSAVKILLCLIAAGVFLSASTNEISMASRSPIQVSAYAAGEFACVLMILLAAISLVPGLLDYFVRWMRQEKQLRMSHQEIKQEQKDDQGDQHIKQQIRKFQQETRNRRSLEQVPTASAVITNPTHYAVAVRYDSSRPGAPLVVAKGTDRFARQIIQTAKDHGVPVLERRAVARALYALTEIGDEVPPEFYKAVAEILAEVYRRRAAG